MRINNEKKWKYLIYIINIKLILLDIFLLVFIILILYFSFLNKPKVNQSPTTIQQNLSDLIKTTDLGEFITSNLSKPSNKQIKDKLKNLNPPLNITKINVTKITENSATITSNDKNIYSGDPINVIYTISISSLNWE